MIYSLTLFLKGFIFVFSAIPDGMIAVQNILTKLGLGAIMKDCEIVTRVCQAVSRRAASLCAAGKLDFILIESFCYCILWKF